LNPTPDNPQTFKRESRATREMYMSADDVEDMLDANELSERFLGEDDE
jgi:hypothetical protein